MSGPWSCSFLSGADLTSPESVPILQTFSAGAAQKVEVPLTPHYWCGELFQVLLFSWSLEGEWGCLQNTILLLIVGAFNTNTLSLQNVKVSLLGRIAEANNFLNFRLRTNSSSPSGLYPYLYTYTYTYPYPYPFPYPCITFS